MYPFVNGSERMPQTDLKSLKVLIVEDDTPSRLCLTLTLEDKVGQVFEADNGKSGLELYHRHTPDVIITDLRMPCMDGLSMIRTLRESGYKPYVIIASGYGEEESYLDAIELKVNLFVKKPYCPENILSGLSRAHQDIQQHRKDKARSRIADGLLSNVPNCHVISDGDHILYFNDPKRILPAQAAEGKDLGAFLRQHFSLAQRNGATRTTLPQDIASWLGRHQGREFILAPNATSGDTRPRRFLLAIDHVSFEEEKRHLLTFTDISLIETEREQLSRLAGRDFLTGVGNRQAFETEIARESKRALRYGTDLCLTMLDIDDFKSVNDTFGHQTGDTVLVELARVLGGAVRVTDVVCRYGGEEFMVIMPQTGLDGARQCALKLGAAIATHDFGIGRPLTVSIGLACCKPGESSQTLVRRVDTALYQAKNSGKNRVVVAQDANFSCTD